MKKGDIPKLFGGMSIMLAVFFGLVLFTNLGDAVDGAKYVYDSTSNYRTTTLISQPSRVTAPPSNIIEGFFDSSREGDLIETEMVNGQKVVRHYRAIHSDQIKGVEGEIVLKLEVYDAGKRSWVTTEVTRIDQEDGTVYFLLKTEEGGEIVPNDYYTGTYQLIIQ